MMVTGKLANQHLLWRAGFGTKTGQLTDLEMEPTTLYHQLEDSASRPVKRISVINDASMLQVDRQLSTAERKRAINQLHRENIQQLTHLWLNEMINSDAQLTEKMAFFWHGHFACRINNSLHQELLLHTIREHAVGNFRNLLKAVSKSAAMLAFLNNQQNKKKKPNENFAREVMELFTMGINHYSERDVKEAARAFTGWGFTLNGKFAFREKVHDAGIKTFLGKTGKFTGDNILDILLEQKATADFICRKIYRYFVNEEINTEQVNWLSERFYAGDYELKPLLRDLFTSDWFYDQRNRGSKIKSPVEFWVGIQRTLPMEIENPQVQLFLLRLLGQSLFYPPNVAGWPGGTSWIDSSSLLLRLRIPQLIWASERFAFRPKADDDVEMGIKGKRNKNPYQIKATIHWEEWTKHFKTAEPDKLAVALSEQLLPIPLNKEKIRLLQERTANTQHSISQLTISLMSMPEYQLC